MLSVWESTGDTDPTLPQGSCQDKETPLPASGQMSETAPAVGNSGDLSSFPPALTTYKVLTVPVRRTKLGREGAPYCPHPENVVERLVAHHEPRCHPLLGQHRKGNDHPTSPSPKISLTPQKNKKTNQKTP